jgi:hypothetical protein
MGLFPNQEGVDCAYGAVKATFQMGSDGVSLAKEQVALVLADEYWSDPKSSSLKNAAEIGLSKPATDVLLQGHAYAPGGNAISSEVRLIVGGLQKTVRIFGNRFWEGGLLGLRISEPEPFQKIPLRYEFAFGGTDKQPEDEAKTDYEPRNPVGRGLVPKKSRTPGKGTPLPNLEDPRQLIKSPKDRPPPACFGPICSHWDPRKSYAGTYDEAWMKKRAPYLPTDFNPRFFQTAPPDQISPAYLKGDESVEISGATPGPPLRFQLPRCTVSMIFHLDGRDCPQTPNLDTVCFEPDEKRLCMIWRSCQVVDKKPHALRELEIQCREFSASKGVG